MVESSAKSVCFFILISWSVDNFKVVLAEFFCLSNLPFIQLLYNNEYYKVLIIVIYYNGVFNFIKVISSFFKCFYYYYKFLIMDLIV